MGNGVFNNPLYFGFNPLSKANLLKKYALANGIPCAYGGEPLTEKTITYEHIVPKSQMGANSYDNYLLVCERHNQNRRTILLKDFLQRNRANGYKANLVYYLAQMKDCWVKGRSYVDHVMPALSEQLQVHRLKIEKAIKYWDPNQIPIAA